MMRWLLTPAEMEEGVGWQAASMESWERVSRAQLRKVVNVLGQPIEAGNYYGKPYVAFPYDLWKSLQGEAGLVQEGVDAKAD